MNPEEKKDLETKITNTIKAMEGEIAELEILTQPISPDNAIGRVSRMDAIHNKSVNEANLRRARMKLSKLQHALGKLAQPDFGNCSRCGKSINPARLMYMPESTFCVNCAR